MTITANMEYNSGESREPPSYLLLETKGSGVKIQHAQSFSLPTSYHGRSREALYTLG